MIVMDNSAIVHHFFRGTAASLNSALRWDMTPQGTGAMGQKLDADEAPISLRRSRIRGVDGSVDVFFLWEDVDVWLWKI